MRSQVSWKETILKKIEERNEFIKRFKAYLSDTSIPLSGRWEAYCLAVDEGILVNSPRHLIRLRTFPKFDEIEGREFSRYETIYLTSLVEMLEEERPSLCLDDVKEEILSMGYSHFIYDW